MRTDVGPTSKSTTDPGRSPAAHSSRVWNDSTCPSGRRHDPCATTFRIACAPKGAADAVAHYLYYDYAIAANATVLLNELGLKLTETDELRIYTGANTLSFSAFGTETL